MKPRHEITKEYNSNPRHQRRWELTNEWLKQFEIGGTCLDCGDRTTFTDILDSVIFAIDKIDNTTHDLNWLRKPAITNIVYNNVFAFEVIEHLLNPLMFLEWIKLNLDKDGSVYLSTPINRPKWMRNKELHFHEFNYNELVHLIEVAGFKIVDEKRINCTTWKMITGFRPLLRFFGIDKNVLLRLRRK